jgi:acyl-CoA synthetase (AMP-forming)/AMP-acid ligase II
MSHSEENQIHTAPYAAQIHGDDRGLRHGEQFERDLKPTTLVELLRHRALRQPEQRAFAFQEDGERESSHLTYSELDQRARSIATVLQDLNAAGERVLLLYPPGLEYVAAFFGCLYAGAIAVPIYPPRPNRTLERLREIVADAQARFALTSTTILSRLRCSLGDEPTLEALRWLDTESVSPDLAQTWKFPELQSNTLAFLQYTSGSTSQPKGVMVSHSNLLNNARMVRQAFELTEESIYVCWLPLYHDMGLIGSVVVPVCAGVPSILMPPLAFLQRPFRWLQAISRYRATVSGGPNFAYDLCARKVTPEQRASLDLSSWRLASNGAEPVRADTMKRFTETFRECGFRPEAFYPCYGLAEATLFASGGLKAASPVLQTVDAGSFERDRVCVTPVGTAATRMLVGCGRAWLDERIVIANPETLTECPPDQVGEIWVSGPNITQGYWNRAEETRQIFHAFLANTEEGPFLRTGDLGFFKDGELFVAGRLKDLIIIEGRNHHPQDIEETVERSHPAIRLGGCAVFSIDVDCQERLVIVVEIERLHRTGRPNAASTAGNTDTQKDEPNDPKAIIQTVRRAVAENHDLQTYVIQLVKGGSIPRTSSGKLRRSACRKAFLAGDMPALGKD